MANIDCKETASLKFGEAEIQFHFSKFKHKPTYEEFEEQDEKEGLPLSRSACSPLECLRQWVYTDVVKSEIPYFDRSAVPVTAASEQHQQQNSSKGWDGSTLSKEEMGAVVRSREEAAMKRVRALQYASLQNEKIGIRRQPMSRDDMDTLNQRWSWLEEWVGSHQPFDKDVPVAHQSPCRDSSYGGRRLGHSSRRSFVRARRTPGRASDVDNNDGALHHPCSPAFPGYMASTASAKAKFRSMSTPKERFAAVPSDAYSEQCFPSFADRLMSPIPSMSPMPSIASDMGFARSSTGRPPVAQRSPRVKGPMTPSRNRSRRSPSRHSFGSEAALHQMQMEQYTPIR
ncbi:protein IQ-DOMAIN 11-like [Lolium rigidum]|uniref:protein IQ-DOMAIN 11-like n=1 Tax=Lolium rigidum TaxID=89674 RepID=UPI001F5D2FF4|nr:protein IQ-DOMAIN 11-like [Lolium rigidum]